MKQLQSWPRFASLGASLGASIVLVASPSRAATVDYATLPGDTCESIALKFWGSPKAYDKLHALNPQLGPAPHHFATGTIVHVVEPGPDAKVTFVRNHVEAATPAPHAAAKNEPLSKGNKVSTLDDSNAEVTFNDETKLQLGEHTLVVILGSTSAKASLGKTAEDTTLVKGTLSAFLAESGGKAKPIQVSTPSGKVDLTSGHAKLAVDDKEALRLAVYKGKSSISAVGKKVDVNEGFGSKAEKGKAPTPPRPLPAAPTWAKAPPRTVLVAADTAEVKGTYAPGTGPGPAVASWHLQVARDEAFLDRALDAVVSSAIVELDAKNLPPGDYVVRVSGIDADVFEGPFGGVARVHVARSTPVPQAAGKRAALDVGTGMFCGLDGAPMLEIKAPIELEPLRAHTLRCAQSADGVGADEVKIPAAQAGLAAVTATQGETRSTDGGVASDLSLRVTDATGAPLRAVKVTAVGDSQAKLLGVDEADGGVYVAHFEVPFGAAVTPVHVSLNGVQTFDGEVAGKDAPGAPPVAGIRPTALELGLVGVVQPKTDALGPALGVGLELDLRRKIGGSGTFVIGLRPTYERHADSAEGAIACGADAPTDACRPGEATYTSKLGSDVFALGLPIAWRFRAPGVAWFPYVGVMPQLLVGRTRQTVGGGTSTTGRLVGGGDHTETSTKLGVVGTLGAQLQVKGTGGVFVELAYRAAQSHVVPGGDAKLSGFVGTLGYRFEL